jgi:hypothetical protein
MFRRLTRSEKPAKKGQPLALYPASTSHGSDIDLVTRSFDSMKFDEDFPLSSNSKAGSRIQANRRKFGSEQTDKDIPITGLDHVIATHGGSTANTERLPGEMERSKHRRLLSCEEENIELKRAHGRLRAEVAYLQEVRKVLMEFYAGMVEVYQESSRTHDKLHRSIQRSSQGLAKAEKGLLRYWGIDIEPDSQDVRVIEDF